MQTFPRSLRIPVSDIGHKITLEALEAIQILSFEELILHMAEHLIGRSIVQTIRLAGQASRHVVLLRPFNPFWILILPPHIAVKNGAGAGRQNLYQGVEHLLLLEYVRRLSDGESQNLTEVKVNSLSEVCLAERQSKLSHVGTDLSEGGLSFEVARY